MAFPYQSCDLRGLSGTRPCHPRKALSTHSEEKDSIMATSLSGTAIKGWTKIAWKLEGIQLGVKDWNSGTYGHEKFQLLEYEQKAILSQLKMRDLFQSGIYPSRPPSVKRAVEACTCQPPYHSSTKWFADTGRACQPPRPRYEAKKFGWRNISAGTTTQLADGDTWPLFLDQPKLLEISKGKSPYKTLTWNLSAIYSLIKPTFDKHPNRRRLINT